MYPKMSDGLQGVGVGVGEAVLSDNIRRVCIYTAGRIAQDAFGGTH